jgi:predicted nucleotidyltransferase
MGNGCALDLEGIRQALSPFFANSRVQKAIVFGSFARGTQDRRSDLDLILVMPTRERFLKRYDEIADLYAIIPSLETEVLIYTPEEWERNADRPFFLRALREGKVIFERGKEQG